MSQITVRQAILADAASITALNNATISTWTRPEPAGIAAPEGEPANPGEVHPGEVALTEADRFTEVAHLTEAHYDDLTLFERWLVGGPWASVEMCAVHIANLLRGSDGLPLVAEMEGQVGAEAEVFIGHEPEPFGHHINIARLCVHPDFANVGLGSALITYTQQIAEAIHCRRVTVAHGETDAELYEHHRFTRQHIGHPIAIQTHAGRVFYQASPLKSFDPEQITGWHMPLGRTQNARQMWDLLTPGFWNSVPEIVEPESARLHVTVTGQEAYALMQQDRTNPTQVHAWVWTKRPINNLLIMALRDWAQRSNYETILTFAWDYVLPLLEVEYSITGSAQHLYARGT